MILRTLRTSRPLRVAGLAAAAALLNAAPALAQCPADDLFEDNDDCASAAVAPLGLTSGLVVQGAANATGLDNDYWVIQGVPAGQILTVDVLFTDAVGDIDVTLYDDAACSVYADGSASTTDNEQVSATNASGATKDYYLEVRAYGTTFDCNDYSLQVSVASDPCTNPLADDGLEDNDDCANAVPMVDGLTTSLFVSKTDEDFYEVSVADGDTLTVDIFFSDATADVDLYLYDDAVTCGDLTSYLARGFSATDDEQVSWTNTSGAVATYYVQVVVYNSTLNGDCNDYDLSIAGSGGVLATSFCLGDGTADVGSGLVACPCGNESALGAGEGCQSSLGYGAILSTAGTATVANDDLSFTVVQARPSQPSLLVQGSTLIAVPFKDGILCMGNPTERIEIVFLDANGAGTTTASIVAEGNVSPGDTRYYQQWFRDPGGVSPCGSGSNFSQGLIVSWN